MALYRFFMPSMKDSGWRSFKSDVETNLNSLELHESEDME